MGLHTHTCKGTGTFALPVANTSTSSTALMPGFFASMQIKELSFSSTHQHWSTILWPLLQFGCGNSHPFSLEIERGFTPLPLPDQNRDTTTGVKKTIQLVLGSNRDSSQAQGAYFDVCTMMQHEHHNYGIANTDEQRHRHLGAKTNTSSTSTYARALPLYCTLSSGFHQHNNMIATAPMVVGTHPLSRIQPPSLSPQTTTVTPMIPNQTSHLPSMSSTPLKGIQDTASKTYVRLGERWQRELSLSRLCTSTFYRCIIPSLGVEGLNQYTIESIANK